MPMKMPHHEILHCSRAEGNVHDPYAVKVPVMKSGIVVRHLLKKISATCFLFLRGCDLVPAKLRMRGDSVQLIWCRESSKYSTCRFLAVRRDLLDKLQKLLALSIEKVEETVRTRRLRTRK